MKTSGSVLPAVTKTIHTVAWWKMSVGGAKDAVGNVRVLCQCAEERDKRNTSTHPHTHDARARAHARLVMAACW